MPSPNRHIPLLDRRRFLQSSAATLTLGCGDKGGPGDTGGPAGEPPESIVRFPRTPIAGDMTDTRVVFTFFVADDSPVRFRVWEGETLVVDQPVAPNGDGFHKLIVDDLTPSTTYRYVVLGGEDEPFENRSLYGQVRTAHAPGSLEPVRLALMCCIGRGTILPDYYFPPTTFQPTVEPFQWELLTHAANHELDALVHLGDQAYLDFVWTDEGGTQEAYLSAWGWYHGGGYRDVYPLAGLYATWDDHESADNGLFDPWAMTPDETERLANAQAVWYRVMPIAAETPAEGPVWRGFRWGDTLELLLLDCRYELTPDRLVSPEQLDWLLERIEASPCRFVCIATPKPFAEITSSSQLLSDNADRWEGYPADRARVTERLDALDRDGVIFVCGDIHTNYLGRVKISGDAPSERCWEVCCSSGNVNPLTLGFSPEQFAFLDVTPHFPVLTFDPAAGTVHVAFYGTDGSLTFEHTLDA